MIQDSLQFMAELSAVTSQIQEFEDAAGAGNTETEAPKSSRNFLDERVSQIGWGEKCIFPPAD